jgi:hypothetical protein
MNERITMKDAADITVELLHSKRRILDSVPKKYHDLLEHYALLSVIAERVDDHLEENQMLFIGDYQEFKDAIQAANAAAAETRPMFSPELKENVFEFWQLIKPESGNKEDCKEITP